MLHLPLLLEGQRQAEVSGLGPYVLYLPQMGAAKCALSMLELKSRRFMVSLFVLAPQSLKLDVRVPHLARSCPISSKDHVNPHLNCGKMLEPRRAIGSSKQLLAAPFRQMY